MSAVKHRRIMWPAERNEEQRRASLRREAPDLARHGNDNLEQALEVEELIQVKRRTWEVFVRWLMIGGLIGALIVIAVLGFVYSGYP